MEFLESKARLKRLAEAADIYVDSNIPIRSVIFILVELMFEIR